jgi:hypothetical protein
MGYIAKRLDDQMVSAAEAEVERNHWPGVIAVVDDGGMADPNRTDGSCRSSRRRRRSMQGCGEFLFLRKNLRCLCDNQRAEFVFDYARRKLNNLARARPPIVSSNRSPAACQPVSDGRCPRSRAMTVKQNVHTA